MRTWHPATRRLGNQTANDLVEACSVWLTIDHDGRERFKSVYGYEAAARARTADVRPCCLQVFLDRGAMRLGGDDNAHITASQGSTNEFTDSMCDRLVGLVETNNVPVPSQFNERRSAAMPIVLPSNQRYDVLASELHGTVA